MPKDVGDDLGLLALAMRPIAPIVHVLKCRCTFTLRFSLYPSWEVCLVLVFIENLLLDIVREDFSVTIFMKLFT